MQRQTLLLASREANEALDSPKAGGDASARLWRPLVAPPRSPDLTPTPRLRPRPPPPPTPPPLQIAAARLKKKLQRQMREDAERLGEQYGWGVDDEPAYGADGQPLKRSAPKAKQGAPRRVLRALQAHFTDELGTLSMKNLHAAFNSVDRDRSEAIDIAEMHELITEIDPNFKVVDETESQTEAGSGVSLMRNHQSN